MRWQKINESGEAVIVAAGREGGPGRKRLFRGQCRQERKLTFTATFRNHFLFSRMAVLKTSVLRISVVLATLRPENVSWVFVGTDGRGSSVTGP